MNKGKSSLTGTVMREVIARVTADNLIGQKLKNGELRKNLNLHEPEWKVPDHFSYRIIPGRNCRLELLEAEETNDRMVLLQLHGGGYVAGMRNAYRDFAVAYSKLGKGISVLTPDYRVGPEHPYPAALEDAIYAYNWLIDRGWFPEEIILAGDSAGGGLAMCLCHYLKRQNRKLPGGLIAMSPWTDMTASGESYVLNYHNDPLFGNTQDSMLYNREYSQGNDLTNPFLSPLYGDFHGFPPMLIQVGSYEMLLSDSELAAEKAKKSGVKVRLSVYEGMFHVFQMAMRMMPESRKAWAEIGRYLEIMMPGR
jgi:monoterpene epsilon-lactone hydrolase